MPFHVGGHKPHSSKRVVSVEDRFLLTMLGTLLVFGGVYRIQHGIYYGLNWLREPVYSYGAIITGVIVIPIAWTPTRWMDKVVARAAKMSSGKQKSPALKARKWRRNM